MLHPSKKVSIQVRQGKEKIMGLEIANIESYVKYANKMPTRQPIGNHLNKLHDRSFDSFVKSITKPKVDIPRELVNSAAKSIEKGGMFLKYSGGAKPLPFTSKLNLNELFTKAMKVAKFIK